MKWAWLIWAGAAGVMVSVAAYVLRLPVAMGPVFEPYLSPSFVPDTGWHVRNLFSVPLLLIGAALAFLASDRPASPEEAI